MSIQEMCARLPMQTVTLRSSVWLSRLRTSLAAKKDGRERSRRLYVSDKVSVGEKSAVAVLHIDGRRLLLATTQSNISLLTELAPEETSGATMKNAASDGKPGGGKLRSSRAVTKVEMI
jgi:flagellar biogenesis protein FliO